MLRVKSLGLLLIVLSVARAHHAMEYIAMESYSTARGGQKIFHVHYDYIVDNSANSAQDHWEYTPGLSYGITNRLMVDAHTHFAKFGIDHIVREQRANFAPQGPSPFMEAMAFAVQYRLTEGSFIDVAIGGVYEEPFQRSRDLLGGQRGFEGILILSRGLGSRGNICANFKLGRYGDEKLSEWALGVKHPLTEDTHGIQAGLELLGDTAGKWSLLPGIYFPLGDQNIVFKTGLEFGKDLNSMRANATLMVIF